MSDYVIKENSGSLFINDRKKEDNHPDWAGKVNINGKLMAVSAWIKQKKDGTEYFSLGFRDWKEKA